MIEVIYKEDTEEQEAVQEPFTMPRNVRQIGLANGDYRIYVEDYVYTFLSSLAEEEKKEGQGMVAVLTGEIQWTADMTCIFVKGALAADTMEAAVEHIDFSEKIWQKIQDDKEQYFPDQEIVGWFFTQRQMAVEITDLFVKVHLRHFGGEKILMLMEPGEREDAFFRYDSGTMVQVSGYYIYYEKNSQMQTYMIERNQKKGQEASEKVEDKAVRNFRKIIDSKKPEEREEERTSVFSYAATVCLALAVLVAGVNFYRNQQQKEGIPEEFRETSASVVQMTPVITKQAVSDTGTPTPSEKLQNRERITAAPTAAAKEEGQISEAPGNEENKDQEQSEKNAAEITVTEVPTKSTETDSAGAKRQTAEKNSEKKEKKNSAEKDSTEETAASAGNTRETYVIRPGDTLYQISLSRYGTVEAMEQICALNGISANEIIYPGQIIVLP